MELVIKLFPRMVKCGLHIQFRHGHENESGPGCVTLHVKQRGNSVCHHVVKDGSVQQRLTNGITVHFTTCFHCFGVFGDSPATPHCDRLGISWLFCCLYFRHLPSSLALSLSSLSFSHQQYVLSPPLMCRTSSLLPGAVCCKYCTEKLL